MWSAAAEADDDDEEWSTIVSGKAKANKVIRRVRAERAEDRKAHVCAGAPCTPECVLGKERLCVKKIREAIACRLAPCPYGPACEFRHTPTFKQ